MNSFKNINLNSLNKNKKEAIGELNDKQVKVLLTNLYDNFFEYISSNTRGDTKKDGDEMLNDIDEVINIINKNHDYDVNPTYYAYRSLTKVAMKGFEERDDHSRVNAKLNILINIISLISSTECYLANVEYLINIIYFNIKYVFNDSYAEELDKNAIIYPHNIEDMLRQLIAKVSWDSMCLEIEIDDIKRFKEIIDTVEDESVIGFFEEELMDEYIKKFAIMMLDRIDDCIDRYDKLSKDGFYSYKKDYPLDDNIYNIVDGVIANERKVVFKLDEKDKIDLDIKN